MTWKAIKADMIQELNRRKELGVNSQLKHSENSKVRFGNRKRAIQSQNSKVVTCRFCDKSGNKTSYYFMKPESDNYKLTEKTKN